jgi:ribonuclease VapC
VIVDTSALIAVLRNESEAEAFARLMSESEGARLSAVSYVEAGAVLDRTGDAVVSRALDELVDAAAIVIEPVTAEQARLARDAYRDFGRGSGHPAALNFGDCFSYALARDTREPLLFKGDDFPHTDITPAA